MAAAGETDPRKRSSGSRSLAPREPGCRSCDRSRQRKQQQQEEAWLGHQAAGEEAEVAVVAEAGRRATWKDRASCHATGSPPSGSRDQRRNQRKEQREEPAAAAMAGGD